MSRSLIVHPSAVADITIAADWYDERHPNLRDIFLAEINDALNKITQNPSQYQVVYRNFRRVLLNRFPYAVFYILSEREIVVTACIHGRRNLPKTLRQK